MRLVDSHCHLNFPDFADDLDAVIDRARAAGVTTMQTICTTMREFPAIRAIAERYEGVYCSVGVHPCHVTEAPLVTVDELVAAAKHPKVIGLGETGLDYHYDTTAKADQQESFRRHIAASRQTGLPVIIHTRDADEDTVAILAEEKRIGDFPALIHCFSSGSYLAEECLAMGLSLSFSGIVTFKSAVAVHDVAIATPLDRLLLETDAPYLAPTPFRGKRNEPSYVTNTAAYTAKLKNASVDDVASASTANFFALFSKAAAA